MNRVEEFLSAQREDAVVCLVCLEAIPFDAATWSCQQSCHMPFHLMCVQVCPLLAFTMQLQPLRAV